MSDIDDINKKLKEQYGTDMLRRPIYRIVWSDKQFEKRCGTFSEWYGSIFVREWQGIKETKKYPGPDYKERWILEKLITGIVNPELWEDTAKGTYEPIWTFRDPVANGYQKPTWKATYFIIQTLLTGKVAETNSDWESGEQKEVDNDIKYYMDYIEGKSGGAIASHLGTGSGIVVPNCYVGTK